MTQQQDQNFQMQRGVSVVLPGCDAKRLMALMRAVLMGFCLSRTDSRPKEAQRHVDSMHTTAKNVVKSIAPPVLLHAAHIVSASLCFLTFTFFSLCEKFASRRDSENPLLHNSLPGVAWTHWQSLTQRKTIYWSHKTTSRYVWVGPLNTFRKFLSLGPRM